MKTIIATGSDKDTVASEANTVTFDHRSRRVPQLHTVAAFIDTQVLPAVDGVIADYRGIGPLQVDADQVAGKVIVADHRAITLSCDKYAAVFSGQFLARSGDGQIH